MICLGCGDWATLFLAARLRCFYRHQALFRTPTALCGLGPGRPFDLSSHCSNRTSPVWVNTTVCLLLFLVLCNTHYSQKDLLGNSSHHKSCPTEDSHHCPSQWCQFLSHQSNGECVSPRESQRTWHLAVFQALTLNIGLMARRECAVDLQETRTSCKTERHWLCLQTNRDPTFNRNKWADCCKAKEFHSCCCHWFVPRASTFSLPWSSRALKAENVSTLRALLLFN